MRPEETELSQATVEAAVEATLKGWGAELYVGQKFWWMDWNRMIRDVLTALRTGEPVVIDDYGGHCCIERSGCPRWGQKGNFRPDRPLPKPKLMPNWGKSGVSAVQRRAARA